MMSETYSKDENSTSSVKSDLSPGPQQSEELPATASPWDATTSEAIVSIAKFLGDLENLVSTVQGLSVSMEKLSLTLSDTSDRACNCKVSKVKESPMSYNALDPKRRKMLDKTYRSEFRQLVEAIDFETGFQRGKDEFQELIRNFYLWPGSLESRRSSPQHLIFRFQLRLRSGLQPEDQLDETVNLKTFLSHNLNHTNWLSIPSNRTRLQERLNRIGQLTITPKWNPVKPGNETQTGQWDSAAGLSLWIPGQTSENSLGLGLSHSRRTMKIDSIVSLAECFFKGYSHNNLSTSTYSNGKGERHVRHVFHQFILSFSNPSHPLAKRSLCSPLFRIGSLVLQYHLSYFTPITPIHFILSSIGNEGLVLERQFVKLRRVSHIRTTSDDEKPSENQYFAEQVLSVSLMMYQPHGTFRLVALGGEENLLDLSDQVPWRNSLSPSSLGTAAGLTHFLNALFWMGETWNRGWNNTLDMIDTIVGFQMKHTFVESHLESYIFDSSSSMHLSKQYFTVLQLLRISRQRIDDDFAGWEDLCRSGHTEKFMRIIVDDDLLDETWKTWETQRDQITDSLRTQTAGLKERIDRRTEEVESLRDGLFNATSLREAMKGMALNRAIYVFTIVTIIYTPLGFVAAFWALPILNTTPEGDSTRPSSKAFVATFIIVPILTYIICGCYVWVLTSTKTWKSCKEFLLSWASDDVQSIITRVKARSGKTDVGTV